MYVHSRESIDEVYRGNYQRLASCHGSRWSINDPISRGNFRALTATYSERESPAVFLLNGAFDENRTKAVCTLDFRLVKREQPARKERQSVKATRKVGGKVERATDKSDCLPTDATL